MSVERSPLDEAEKKHKAIEKVEMSKMPTVNQGNQSNQWSIRAIKANFEMLSHYLNNGKMKNSF